LLNAVAQQDGDLHPFGRVGRARLQRRPDPGKRQLREQIDEDVGQFLRRGGGCADVNCVVFGLQDLSIVLHQRLGHRILAREETIERADLRICPRCNLRHRRRLDGRRGVYEVGDALATRLTLGLERCAVPA
jgi:hypothetical protein